MKFAVFACLLVIAGVHALPQPASEEVAVAGERIFDYWFINYIANLSRTIIERGLDPADVDYWSLNYNIWDGSIQIKGFAKDVHFTGLSHIVINSVSYNFLLGLFSWDISLPKLSLKVGTYEVYAQIGDFTSNLEVSGRVEIENIRLAGNALLNIQSGHVTITNINVELTVDHSESDLRVFTNRDVSCCVNTFFNRRFQELLIEHKDVIGTFIGEMIRNRMNTL